MANATLVGKGGSIGPAMSPAAKRSLNEDPRSETGPTDVLPLSDGPIKDPKTDCLQPARYTVVGQDRHGNVIEMIREDR